MKTNMKTNLITFGLFVFVFGLWAFFGKVVVTSNSMSPSLNEGDVLMVNKLMPFVFSPSVGDIVIVESPDNLEFSGVWKTPHLIKRVVAIPYDLIVFDENETFIVRGDETIVLNEPFLSAKQPTGTYSVPEGHWFVVGDNRSSSMDSRDFGSISKESIKGLVWKGFFPFKKTSNQLSSFVSSLP